MTLAGGITLCRVVANACPTTMPAFVKKGAARLAEVAEEAQKAHIARKKARSALHCKGRNHCAARPLATATTGTCTSTRITAARR